MTASQQMLVSGGGGIVNPIPIPNLSHTVIDPSDANCSVTFDNDGDGNHVDGSGTVVFNWFNPTIPGVGANYWIRLTVNSGTAPAGSATATWLQLNSARAWNLARTTIGTSTGNYTIQIASDSGGATIVSSVTFTMTSTVDV